MTNTYKVLAQGQLPNAAGILYTVPGATQTVIHHIVIVNTDSAVRWAELFVGGTAAANEILPQADIPIGGWAEDDGVHTLEAAQTLQGVAEVATKLTYTIYGLEIS